MTFDIQQKKLLL